MFVSSTMYLRQKLQYLYEMSIICVFVVNGEHEDMVSIRADIIPEHPFSDKRSLHFYHVTCTALGEQQLVVSIGNRPSPTNQFPASSNVTIKFACMLPAVLNLEPHVLLPEIFERRLSLQDCQSPNKEV